MHAPLNKIMMYKNGESFFFFYEKLPVSTICHFVKSSFYSQSTKKTKKFKPSSLLSYLNDDFFFDKKKKMN